MFQSILIYHAFIDGMKRTGIFTSLAFLLRNGYLFRSKSVEDSIEFAIHVADRSKSTEPELMLDEICDWFSDRITDINDDSAIIEWVVNSKQTFSCPRCGNLKITMGNPLCPDCAMQLTGYHTIIDAIVDYNAFDVVIDTIDPVLFSQGRVSPRYHIEDRTTVRPKKA